MGSSVFAWPAIPEGDLENRFSTGFPDCHSRAWQYLVGFIQGTSLAAMITVSEMFMDAQIVAGANQDYMTIYITIAVIYCFFCWLMTVGQTQLERALAN